MPVIIPCILFKSLNMYHYTRLFAESGDRHFFWASSCHIPKAGGGGVEFWRVFYIRLCFGRPGVARRGGGDGSFIVSSAFLYSLSMCVCVLVTLII
jgi:hypothetical protein